MGKKMVLLERIPFCRRMSAMVKNCFGIDSCIACTIVLCFLAIAFRKPEITGLNGSFNLLFFLVIFVLFLIYGIKFVNLEELLKDKNFSIQIDKYILKLENKEKEVNKLIKETNQELINIGSATNRINNRITEFQSFQELLSLWAKAECDDRFAFEEIKKLAITKPSYHHQEVAQKMVRQIEDKYQFVAPINVSIAWDKLFWVKNGATETVDPNRVSLTDFKIIFSQAEFDGVAIANIIRRMSIRNDFSKKEKIEFLMDIIRNSKSLTAVKTASDILNQDARITSRGFKTEELLDWYEKNKDKF